MNNEELCRYMISLMYSNEGRKALKEMFREIFPPEVAKPFVDVVDGELDILAQAKDGIRDNALDALNDGRWSREETARVLTGGPIVELLKELKKREVARRRYIWQEVYDKK